MTRWTSRALREDLLVFGAALAGSAVFLAVYSGRYITDADQYRIVTDGGVPTWGPFASRVLTPYLARVVPHRAVTAIGVATAAAFLLAFLRPIVGRYRWVGVGFFFAGPALVALMYPLRVDGVLLAAIAAAFWCIQGRRWWLLAGVVAVGTANHELMLLVLPAVAVVGVRERDWRAAAPVVAGLSVYLVLHRTTWFTAAHPPGSEIRMSRGFFESMAWEPVSIRANGYVLVAFVWELVRGWGLAVFVAPFGWRRMPGWLRDCVVIVPFGMAMWFIASDWYRTVLPAFPIVLTAACFGVQAGVEARCRLRAGVGAEHRSRLGRVLFTDMGRSREAN